MNAKNLPLKFGLVAFLIAAALYGTLAKTPKLGIDLRGGSSLTFEILTNESKIQKIEEDQKALTAQLEQAKDDKAKKAIQDQLTILAQQLENLKKDSGDPGDLADRIIALLKKRIDPQGFYNLEWRPVGKNRIEIRMPAADPDSKKAQEAYQAVLDKLAAGNLQRGDIYRVVDSKGAAREEQIRAFSGSDPNRAVLLAQYAEAMDAAAQARADAERLRQEIEKGGPTSRPEAELKALETQQGKALDDLAAAQSRANQLFDELEKRNVSTAAMSNILRNYVTQQELENSTDQKALEIRKSTYEEGLEKVLSEHPSRKQEIEDVVAAYRKWAQARQRLDDPSDLVRLVRNAGVLEFRIAPLPPSTRMIPQDAPRLTQDEISHYKEVLQDPTEGPDSLRRKNDKYLWFPVHPGEDLPHLITSDAHGRTYVLLCNQSEHMMLQNRGEGGWTLTKAYVTYDEQARPAVGFEFNAPGSKVFGELTGSHIEQPMAILLDDEVYSAPNIQTKITGSGRITGQFTTADVRQLVSTLEAGSLPARLNPEPVAQSTFGPSLGLENLRSALRAGYISAIVIVAFMVVYYLLAGAIANFALAMNVLLVIGAMGAFDVVFTLPGIAGVILVIGMAVDANVLIYERIREEQAKGQTIRMALKNGYDRAFSAIFDSNLTTLISAAILGWVGTEEVRGFAITLGLGVAFNVFTAVWVTRWIFQLLMELGWLERPLKMLRLIGVPKVDWMGMRYYFWGFSILTLVLGVSAFIWQGSDILGIEFSSGTQATITFRQDALIDGQLPNDKLVREKFVAAARDVDRLASTARVEMVVSDRVSDFLDLYDPNQTGKVTLAMFEAKGGSKAFFEKLLAATKKSDQSLNKDDLEKYLPAKSYQISTTESNVPLIQDRVSKAFGAALAQRLAIEFDLEKGQPNSILKVDLAGDGLTKITRAVAEKADPRYRLDLLDAEGGVLLVTRLKTPESQKDTAERIRDVAFQPDFSKIAENRIKVIGLTPAGPDKYSEFAFVVIPGDPAVAARNETWTAFAQQELSLVTEALHRQQATVATNFDAAIAGQAQQLAIVATILAWFGIIVYLWVRFGQFRWGLAAVLCLVHDVTIILGMVAISGWVKTHLPAVASALMVDSFKIDMTMVAALLTVIGYSVNDTIVVFDRIRENRGRLVAVTPEIINASINQTLSRTILTSMTVFVVVLIMYAVGGQGIHAFNYALLIGVFIGTYSSIAVAAPMLLGAKEMMIVHHHAETAPPEAPAAK